jgi:kynurenine formamidase
MLLNLAYTLSRTTPFYSGLAAPRVDTLYSLADGHDCNSYYLTTSNHAGTHVDAPRHFNATGRRIAEYGLDELFFRKPALADLQIEQSGLIGQSNVEAMRVEPADCDILLIRTGFGRLRRDHPEAYVARGPGFDRSGAEAILRRCASLRALGVDFMSISALAHPQEGAAAHRVFLGCAGYSDRETLLIEDMLLPPDLTAPESVRIVPWLVEELDSAPCSVLAEVRDRGSLR